MVPIIWLLRNLVLLSMARPSDLQNVTQAAGCHFWDQVIQWLCLLSGCLLLLSRSSMPMKPIDCLVERLDSRDMGEASRKATQRLGLQSDSLQEPNPATCSELRSRSSYIEPWYACGAGRTSIRMWASLSQWAQFSCTCIPVHKNREITHVCWVWV